MARSPSPGRSDGRGRVRPSPLPPSPPSPSPTGGGIRGAPSLHSHGDFGDGGATKAGCGATTAAQKEEGGCLVRRRWRRIYDFFMFCSVNATFCRQNGGFARERRAEDRLTEIFLCNRFYTKVPISCVHIRVKKSRTILRVRAAKSPRKSKYNFVGLPTTQWLVSSPNEQRRSRISVDIG